MRKKETPNPSRVRGMGVEVSETLFYIITQNQTAYMRLTHSINPVKQYIF